MCTKDSNINCFKQTADINSAANDDLKLTNIGFIHDMENLTGIIIGNIDLLMMSLPEEKKTAKRLESTKSTVLRAMELCKDFVKQSELTHSRKHILSFDDIIQDISELNLPGSTTIDFNITGNLWYLYADSQQIGLIIKNLIYNAEQAMEAGGIVSITAENLTVENSRVVRDGDYVIISVKDNGCGIPEELMGKIFRPGFSTKVNGTGMGLTLCKAIIDKHSGYIRVESMPGRGTVFSVLLPALKHT